MKTVFKSDEIAHVWANRGAPSGRCPSNMRFDGDAFYSYGTVIARRITHKGREAYVIDSAHFSQSTTQHWHTALMAIPSAAKIFHVREGKRGQYLYFTASELVAHYERRSKETMEREPSRYARKRAEQYTQATQLLMEAKEAAEFFGLGTARLTKEIAKREAGEATAADTLKEYGAKLEERRKKEEAAKLVERTARNIAFVKEYLGGKNNDRFFDLSDRYQLALDSLPEDLRVQFVAAVERNNGTLLTRWLAGEPVDLPRDCPTMLRAEEGEMVTSRGARVPLEDARKTYRFATALRAKGWHRNGEQHAIGMYQLDAINEQGVVAGCHRVTWAEIDRFAATQGWAK